jgi:hypothetical protein
LGPKGGQSGILVLREPNFILEPESTDEGLERLLTEADVSWVCLFFPTLGLTSIKSNGRNDRVISPFWGEVEVPEHAPLGIGKEADKVSPAEWRGYELRANVQEAVRA